MMLVRRGEHFARRCEGKEAKSSVREPLLRGSTGYFLFTGTLVRNIERFVQSWRFVLQLREVPSFAYDNPNAHPRVSPQRGR